MVNSLKHPEHNRETEKRINDAESFADKSVSQDVSAEIVQIGEGAESLIMGNVAEDEGDNDENATDSAAAAQGSKHDPARVSPVRIVAEPQVEQMIAQTLLAIDQLIDETIKKVKELSRSKLAKAVDLNEGVIEIRRLRGLKYQLINAKNLATELIKSLWSKYVRRL